MNQILRRLDTLTAMPQSVIEATCMLQQDSVTAAELERVFGRDEALSVQVLRWANSTRYGRQGCTFTLQESIVRLGRSTLLKLVLQQGVGDRFNGAGSANGLQRGALWRSALGGAIAAEHLARREGSVVPSTAYLCGLLRDIGKLALDAYYGPAYFEQLCKDGKPEGTFVEAERRAFGFDHAQLGGELAIRWGLPDRIAGAIAQHHAPPAEAPARDALFDIVHAADVTCMWAGLAIGNDGLQYEFAPHVHKILDLSRSDVEQLILNVYKQVSDIEDSMSADSSSKGARFS